MTSSKRAALELQQLFVETSRYELELLEVLDLQLTWRTRGEAVLCGLSTPEPLSVIVYEDPLHTPVLVYFQAKRLPELLRCRDPVTLSNHDFVSRTMSLAGTGNILLDFVHDMSTSSWHQDPPGNDLLDHG